MADPLDARSLVSGVDPATLPNYPQRVLPRMTFAMVNGQMVPTDDGPDAPPDAPLATSREDVDPAQLGSLVARLMHASTTKGPLQPPQQSAQPVLSPAAASIVPPRAAAVSHAQVPVAHIGAPVVGERYVPPTFPQIMTSDQPLLGVAEASGLFGAARPRAVQSADPYGIDAWMKGAGPPPLMMGTTENVGESALGRGLYSRVDDVAASLPERGLHPNKVASLLKSGASQEELAYRKLPEFLASKGNNPVTRAEMQAHLQANPAPMPSTTVLGVPRQPGNYTVVHEGTDGLGRALRVEIRRPDGSISWSNANGGPVAPDQLQSLIDTYHNQPMPEKVNRQTKYASYTLPEGENYREHLLQLPNTPDAALQSLTDRRDAIRDAIAAIDVPIQEHTLPTDPAQVKQWFDEQVAHRRALMEEHSALNDQIDAHKQRVPARADYQEGHYGGDYPNVLAHVRTTERNLPVNLPTTLPENYQVHEDPRNGRFYYQTPEGRGAVDDHATMEQATRAAMEHAGLLNEQRGRFLEEVQSDWHQQGKRSGYQTPPTPAQQQRLTQLPGEITAAQQALDTATKHIESTEPAYLGRMRDLTREALPPEFQHLTSFADALRQQPPEAAVAAWRAARDPLRTAPELESLRQANEAAGAVQDQAIARLNALRAEQTQLTKTSGVPNAPFKEAWPDLALKQQLLDVARDPHANWLGFTGGKTQAARYDLSKQVSQLSYEPAARGDYSQGTLVALDHEGNEVIRKRGVEPHELDDLIGKEPAAALRNKFIEHERMRAYERDQWSIQPDARGGFNVHDPNGEVLHNRRGDPEWFPRADIAQEHIDSLVEQSGEESPRSSPASTSRSAARG